MTLLPTLRVSLYAVSMEDRQEKTLRRDVAVLSEGFRSCGAAAGSRWSDVRVVLSDGACASHRLVLASARDAHEELRNHLSCQLVYICNADVSAYSDTPWKSVKTVTASKWIMYTGSL